MVIRRHSSFEEQGLETARAYLTKAIDSKLSTRLKTLRDEAGNFKVAEDTTVEEIIKLLEDLYVEAKPLWGQRTNYFKEVQGPNESFDDYWSRKMVLKEACQLLNGITTDDLDVLEIMRGVHSNELRKELLKVRTPKPNELVKIARNWQHGKEMEKLFQSTTRGAKASDYKQDKNEAQQQKAKEVADAKAKGKGTDNILRSVNLQLQYQTSYRKTLGPGQWAWALGLALIFGH